MSMLRHRFSNERWGAALNHLPLLFCNENVTIQQSKSPTQRQRWIPCSKEPTFCQNSQLVKLAKKLRKNQLFERNLDLN